MNKLWVLILVVLLCGCEKVSSSSSSDQKPNASFKWTSAEPFAQASSIGDAETFDLVFLDQDHVALAVLFASSPEVNAGQKFRDTVVRTGVVAVVNAKDGHLEASKTWSGIVGQPAFDYKLELHSTASGNLLVGLGDMVYLLSSSLLDKAKRQLPLGKVERNGYSYQNMWSLRVSPTGKSALLISYTPDYEVENHWIEPDSLKERSVSAAPRYSLVQLLDDSVVFNENNSPDSGVVQIQPIGNSSHQLCQACIGAVSSTFGKGNIFISTKPDASYLVADSAGRQLYANTRSGSPSILRTAGARTNRIAFEYGNIKGLSSVTNFSVLDLDVKREVWNLQLSEQPKTISGAASQFTALQFMTPRIAMSPNGDKVAILNADTLSVFAIK